MDSHFWFYTLSAIPQTLGAIIALAAIFVIFKLDHIENRLQKESREIEEWLMPLFPSMEIHEVTRLDYSAMLQKLSEGIKKLSPGERNLAFDGYNKLCDLLREVIASYKRYYDASEERIYEYLAEKERILKSLLEVRKNALRRLKISLYFIVLSIVASIIFLPLYESIDSYAPAIVTTLVILAVSAVVYTGCSVWDIARRQLR